MFPLLPGTNQDRVDARTRGFTYPFCSYAHTHNVHDPCVHITRFPVATSSASNGINHRSTPRHHLSVNVDNTHKMVTEQLCQYSITQSTYRLATATHGRTKGVSFVSITNRLLCKSPASRANAASCILYSTTPGVPPLCGSIQF